MEAHSESGIGDPAALSSCLHPSLRRLRYARDPSAGSQNTKSRSTRSMSLDTRLRHPSPRFSFRIINAFLRSSVLTASGLRAPRQLFDHGRADRLAHAALPLPQVRPRFGPILGLPARCKCLPLRDLPSGQWDVLRALQPAACGCRYPGIDRSEAEGLPDEQGGGSVLLWGLRSSYCQ